MILPDKTVKVADFGIARASKFDTVTMTDKAIGSVHYISPEQASGGKTDEKSDIYSVGVMLYEMITGVLPFEGDTPVTVALMQVQSRAKLPSEIYSEIPKGLEEIIMKAMAKNPDNRYSSSKLMLEDIEKVKADNTIVFGYSLFVDEAPTRIIGDIDSFLGEKGKKGKNEYIKPIVFGIVSAVLLFIIGWVIVYFVAQNAGSNGVNVEVPNLVGLDYTTIVNDKAYTDKFLIVQGKSERSDKYEAGQIIKQSPEIGKKVQKGTTIVCDISTGIDSAIIPDVKGLDIKIATQKLEKENFKVTLRYESSDTIAKDIVIKTEPEANSSATSDGQVVLVVSSGVNAKLINIPNVVGLYEQEAIDKIKELGFVAPTVVYQDPAIGDTPGKVVKQAPGQGLVDANTKIIITIISGI
jgi:serine/threonine-protein kinase